MNNSCRHINTHTHDGVGIYTKFSFIIWFLERMTEKQSTLTIKPVGKCDSQRINFCRCINFQLDFETIFSSQYRISLFKRTKSEQQNHKTNQKSCEQARAKLHRPEKHISGVMVYFFLFSSECAVSNVHRYCIV